MFNATHTQQKGAEFKFTLKIVMETKDLVTLLINEVENYALENLYFVLK